MSLEQPWEFVAGHIVLDFVNTVDDRRGLNPREFLNSPADLAAWGVQSGLLSPSAAAEAAGDRPGRAELAAARRLRDHLVAILDARQEGRQPPAAALTMLSEQAAEAYAAGRLAQSEAGELDWHWDRAAIATVRHVVAVAAVNLLSGPAAARIRECAGDACGWYFLDATKRGNRRWCSMGECGQEAKTARRRTTRARDRAARLATGETGTARPASSPSPAHEPSR